MFAQNSKWVSIGKMASELASCQPIPISSQSCHFSTPRFTGILSEPAPPAPLNSRSNRDYSTGVTPMPAAASHRLPPSEALSELDIHSHFPCSLRGQVFERMSKIHRLEGGRSLRSRFPRIGDHNA